MSDQVPRLDVSSGSNIAGSFQTLAVSGAAIIGGVLTAAGIISTLGLLIGGASATFNGVNILPSSDNSGQVGSAILRFNTMFGVLGQFDSLSTLGGTFLVTRSALANNAAAQVATLTNGPTAGNPTKWIPINDNGTTRNIPCW